MKIQKMPSRKRWQSGLLTALLLLTSWLSSLQIPALASTPALPSELKKDNAGKMVLLDFYSAFCGTCQMMEPYVKALTTKTNKQLTYQRIDLGDSGNEKYMKLYGIEGTPTYILYNAQGQPLYRMQDYITPVVLERQILRLTGQLKPTDFPAGVTLPTAHQQASGQQPSREELEEMILISFETENCEPCHAMTPYLEGFEMTEEKGLHIMHVDSTSPTGKALMGKLAIKAVPAYVLFDNNASATSKADARGELFRMTGAIQPRLLWEVIRMFGNPGV